MVARSVLRIDQKQAWACFCPCGLRHVLKSIHGLSQMLGRIWSNRAAVLIHPWGAYFSMVEKKPPIGGFLG
ncbi:MAG: hypothetical protein ACJA1T_000660 [Zhongshania aliphaticivorans]|jgi:hypothetical protein